MVLVVFFEVFLKNEETVGRLVEGFGKLNIWCLGASFSLNSNERGDLIVGFQGIDIIERASQDCIFERGG